MSQESTELKRLDFAAKAECAADRANSATIRIIVNVLALFVAFLAITSEAPPHETLLMRILAIVAVVGVLVSWIQLRYSGYAWAAILLTFAVGTLLTGDYSRTTLGWMAKLLYVVYFAYVAFCVGKRAWNIAVIHGPKWQKEREQVRTWLEILLDAESSGRVLQFSSGSFWSGYFDYRILNTRFCWVVAKFKKGNAHKIAECRVLDLSAIQQTERHRGKLNLTINNRSIPNVRVSPDMQAILSSALNLK